MVIAALFGYCASWWHARQETKARRAVLFRTLSDQLYKITTDVPAFDETEFLMRTPIRTSAVDELLRGNSLEATKDSKLVKRFIIWQSFEASNIEQVRITNQAAVNLSVPKDDRAAWHQRLNEAQSDLTLLRKDVLAVLQTEYHSPSCPQDPEKDKGITFRDRMDDQPKA